MSSLETRRTTAHALPSCPSATALTRAVPYPPCHSQELPTDPAALALIRRSNWRLPEVDGRTVRFEALDGSAGVAFDFDAHGRIERVAIVAGVRSGRSQSPQQPDSKDNQDDEHAALVTR